MVDRLHSFKSPSDDEQTGPRTYPLPPTVIFVPGKESDTLEGQMQI